MAKLLPQPDATNLAKQTALAMEANGGWHYLVNDPLFYHTVNVLRTVVCKVV